MQVMQAEETLRRTAKLATSDDPLAWSNAWRPAPANLVDEWRSMGSTAKSEVVRVRHDASDGKETAYVSNCGLGNGGAAVLAEALRTHTRLRNINVSRNAIGDAGAIALAEVLEHNSDVQVLCLSANEIGNDGATRLAKILKWHTGIKMLSLDSNLIGDAGAFQLAGALSSNARSDIKCVLSDNPVKRFDETALANLGSVAVTVKALSEQGITLGHLLQFFKEGCAQGTIIPRQTTTGEVAAKLVIPASKSKFINYAQAVTPGNPPPMVQVIHAWDGYFDDLVRTVASHACGKRDPNLDPSDVQWCYSPELTGKSYFIDVFCVNQHAHINVREYGQMSRFVTKPVFGLGTPGCEVDKLHFTATRIQQRGGRLLLVMDNQNLVLTRVQCLYEVFQAIEDDMQIDVVFCGGARMLAHDKRDRLLQSAKASSDQVQERILQAVRDSPGGFDTFNKVVLDFVDRHVDLEFESILNQFEAKARKHSIGK